ncbi:MAG: beta-ketoacyl synthase chain length factor [Muribaculaceae bacterium]|nr:beta-ketoacyl synthase chain length factor [Muribaculaceae bacterium]
MTSNKVYIKSVAHISAQQPLSDEWLSSPVVLQGDFVQACEPVYKDYISPMAARRMTPILKRAIVTAKAVLNDTDVDAIITGTGLGSAACSEKLINAMIEEGEAFSMPTQFMQSTHNTIGSLVAIDRKCHAYNATYSQDGISAECALLDAFVQIRLGKINNALVGIHDELPKSWLEVMKRSKIIGNLMQVPASETSISMLLDNNLVGSKCEIAGIEVAFNTSFDKMLSSFMSHYGLPQVDALMMGKNGWEDNDKVYDELLDKLSCVPALHYKHISGESCAASAFGVYASALCLEHGIVPATLQCDNINCDVPVKNILLANASGNNKSLILLRSCD